MVETQSSVLNIENSETIEKQLENRSLQHFSIEHFFNAEFFI